MSLTTRCSPDQQRRPHPSSWRGFLVRKPQSVRTSGTTPCRLQLIHVKHAAICNRCAPSGRRLPPIPRRFPAVSAERRLADPAPRPDLTRGAVTARISAVSGQIRTPHQVLHPAVAEDPAPTEDEFNEAPRGARCAAGRVVDASPYVCCRVDSLE
jgi:hypothetical protein